MTSTAVCKQKLIVADIRFSTDGKFTTVLFLKSARFYQLPVQGKHYKHDIILLQRSLKQHTPVVITRQDEQSVIILHVSSPATKGQTHHHSKS